MSSSVIDSSRSSSDVRHSKPEPHFHAHNVNPYPDLDSRRPRSNPKPAKSSSQWKITLMPAEGWLVLLFLAIAVYSVVGAIVAANWVQHSRVLLVSPLVGLLAGLVVAKTPRLPQALLHLAACLVGHWFSVWLTSVIAFHENWMVLLGSLRTIILGGSLTAVAIPNSDMIFFFYLAFLCFFLGYFGCWLVYRAHLPWLVALVYCSIMLVDLNSYTRQDLSYLVALLLGALILLIARTQLTAQVAQWKREGLHTDRSWLNSMTRRCMQIASVLTVCTLLIAFLLPIANQPLSGQVLWNNLDNAWNNVVNGRFSWQDPGSLIRSYQAPTNFFGNQLTITGSVHLPVGEVLSYVSNGGPRYLEGFTYNVFDGHTWTTSLATTDTQSYDANTPLKPDVFRNDYSQVTTTVTIVQPPEGVKHYIFGPAQPVSFDVATVIDGDNTATAWTQQSPLVRGEHYQVVSSVPPSDAQALSGVPLPAANPDYWHADANATTLSSNYTQVPRDLSPNVLNTMKLWTQGANDTYGVLTLLEKHLSDQSQFTYSIDNSPIPGNVDVVDWLLQTRRGYCTYYASAMAIMARQLGIPTRVVNGFSHGHFDVQRKVWVVRGEDAHSWVQAYFPSVGWVSFDPTPGFAPVSLGKPQPSPTATKPPTKTTPTPPVKATPPTKNNPPTTPPNTYAGGTGNTLLSQGMLVWFSVLVLFCSLLFFGVSVVTYWWRNLYKNSTAVSGLFWRLCYIASWAGFSPRSSQTPYEYMGMLSRHFPQTGRSFWSLTELFVRDRWGSPVHVPHMQEQLAAEQHWSNIRGALVHLFLKRIKRS